MIFSQAKRLLIGKPKKNKELQNEKISNTKALAILSSDALSSVAYGPEQILIVLSGYSSLVYTTDYGIYFDTVNHISAVI